MNSDIFKLIRERDKLKQKAWKNKDEKKMKEYRKLRNKVTFEIRKRKKEYYSEQLLKFKVNAGSTWKVLKSLLPCKNSNTNIFQTDKEKLYEKSEHFNEYFANVGKLLPTTIPITHRSVLDQECHNVFDFNFGVISEENVLKEIKLLKNKSSCGIDGILDSY